MKKTFACPHCRSVLNPSVKILLTVRHAQKQGMILLSPQPGNYKFICDPTVEADLKPGVALDFFCPVCAKNLESPSNKKFVEIFLRTPGGRECKVEFSRLYGTHATFIVDGDEITTFGDDVQDFGQTNFFGS
ncbi:hypothetical protein CSB20_14325 [bacterium DOLZORAL124_64_63]|nr:MAG: hypothetical protein CSB20_14325 [bacterium DOLZORAL124_64_63]